jgi:hypothetical protein
VIIAPRFADALAFHEGLAAVRPKKTTVYGMGDSWGYIDKSGQYMIEPQFNEAHPFQNGVARVHVGGKLLEYFDAPPGWEGGQWQLIDRTGKVLKQSQEWLEYPAEAHTTLVRDGQARCASRGGERIAQVFTRTPGGERRGAIEVRRSCDTAASAGFSRHLACHHVHVVGRVATNTLLSSLQRGFSGSLQASAPRGDAQCLKARWQVRLKPAVTQCCLATHYRLKPVAHRMPAEGRQGKVAEMAVRRGAIEVTWHAVTFSHQEVETPGEIQGSNYSPHRARHLRSGDSLACAAGYYATSK